VKRDTAQLIAFLNDRATMPYAWGSTANDCISFVNGAVIAQTGKCALSGAKWSGKTGALRVLKRVGGIAAALDARFERIPVAFARRGDIAGVPVEAMRGIADAEAALIGLHPAIVEGMTLAAPGERGLRRMPRSLAIVAWDVTRRKMPAHG
jgi:hypothetical protein